MNNLEVATKIASIAWDTQPRFRHRYRSANDLAEHLLVAYEKGGTNGWFLPLAVLEVVVTVDDLKATIMHAELDRVMGDSTITDSELEFAHQQLEIAQKSMPLLKRQCGNWFDDGVEL